MSRTARVSHVFLACALLLLAGVAHDALWRCYAAQCMRAYDSRLERAAHLVHRARAFDKKGHYEMAEYTYRFAHTLDPLNTAALTELADLMRHRGRYLEAEAFFLEALARDPESDWLHLDLGKLYRNMKRYEDALASFNTAQGLNPLRPELWSYGYSQTYKELRMFEDAERTGLRATALDPEESYHFMSLGDVYREWKRYDDAKRMYRRALELNSRSEAYMGLAWLYLEMGDIERAEEQALLFNERVRRPRAEVYAILSGVATLKGDPLRAAAYAKSARYYDRTVGAGSAIVGR